jgi:hypothetical protein
MQSRKSGYFLVYRDVWKHPVFKNLVESAIWLYMISSASHKDKTARYLDNEIFIKRGELIFPLRKNAKIWKIPYTAMRTFILRLKRRGMINHRLTTLKPTAGFKYSKITIINVLNYDKFQYVDPVDNQRLTNDSAYLIHNTNTLISNIQDKKKVIKSSKDDYEKIGDEGHYVILRKDNKKYLKHKFKDEPLKDY